MKTVSESPLIPKPTITESEIDLSGEREVNDLSSADGVKSVYTISVLVLASMPLKLPRLSKPSLRHLN
jgi:hypothetical protein